MTRVWLIIRILCFTSRWRPCWSPAYGRNVDIARHYVFGVVALRRSAPGRLLPLRTPKSQNPLQFTDVVSAFALIADKAPQYCYLHLRLSSSGAMGDNHILDTFYSKFGRRFKSHRAKPESDGAWYARTDTILEIRISHKES